MSIELTSVPSKNLNDNNIFSKLEKNQTKNFSEIQNIVNEMTTDQKLSPAKALVLQQKMVEIGAPMEFFSKFSSKLVQNIQDAAKAQ